jgi:type I restriction enzyme S subunit
MRWPVLRLEELAAAEPASIKIGPFGSQLKKSELVSSGVHVVGIENIIAKSFDDLGSRYITEEKFKTLSSVEIKPGDVLITMMGTIGKVCVVPPLKNTSIMDSHLLRFRPNRELCSPEYVTWLIRGSHSVREALANRAHGAIMKGLNSGIIRSLPAPLPPLKEQARIVELLDETEALQNLRGQADVRTTALIPALFHEMFGDSEHTPYAVKPLADLVRPDRPITYGILKPGPDTEGGVPYVRVLDIKQHRLHAHQLLKTTRTIAEQYRRSILSPGDILVTIRGTVGRTCVVPDELEGANITQDTARLAIISAMAGRYVVEFLNTPWAQSWMSHHMVGQAVKGINLGDLRKIPIPVPPRALQDQFAQRVAKMRELEGHQGASRQCMDNLFQSMIHRAFSGNL